MEDNTHPRMSFKGIHSEAVIMDVGMASVDCVCCYLEWLGEMHIILNKKWMNLDYV